MLRCGKAVEKKGAKEMKDALRVKAGAEENAVKEKGKKKKKKKKKRKKKQFGRND